MNLKSNKGYIGVDASIAIIIVMVIFPTIMGLLFNINSTSQATKIKTEALNIATNVLETAKGIDVKDLDEEQLLQEVQRTNVIGDITVNTQDKTAIFSTDTASYKLSVSIEDYASTHQGTSLNMVKTLQVIVRYKAENREQAMEIKTVLK